MSSKISPCCFWDEIPAQPSSISRTVYRNSSKCLQRSHHVLSGTKSPPNLPLFPHGPSETCRSLAEKDRVRRGPTTPGERPGGGARRLRRLLLEEREASQVAQTSCVEKWRKGWRRLLLEEAWGSSQRVAATTPGGSLGEARRGSRRLLLETLPEMLRDPAQTFAGRYFLEANWRKGHEAPSNEILQFPRVFPHFGQKSWGPPHGF